MLGCDYFRSFAKHVETTTTIGYDIRDRSLSAGLIYFLDTELFVGKTGILASLNHRENRNIV